MGNTGKSKWGGAGGGYTPPGKDKDKGKSPGRPPKDKEPERDDELDGYDIGGIPEHSKPKKGKGKKGEGTTKPIKPKEPKEKEEPSEIDKLFPKEPRGPRRKLTDEEKRLKELEEQKRNTPERIAERERKREFRNLSPEEKEKYFQEQRDWNKHIKREYNKFEKEFEKKTKIPSEKKMRAEFESWKVGKNIPAGSAEYYAFEKFKSERWGSVVGKDRAWAEKLTQIRNQWAKRK